MRLFYLIILLTFFSGNLFAQNEAELSAKALKEFQKGDYESARKDYLSLVTQQPRNAQYNYYYGISIVKTSPDRLEALNHLEYAANSDGIPVDVYYYIGKLYHLNYQFDKAITFFRIYLSKQPNDPKTIPIDDVQRLIEMCQNGKSLLKDISDVKVIDKKEYSKDEFFRLYNEKNLNGNILVSALDQQKIDKKNNYVPVIFYPNQSKILFFASYGDKDNGSKDIYYKTKSENGWSDPKLVAGDVNTTYDEDYPYYDEANKTLYFSSKGHNSMGGYDIFKADYDESTQSFKNVKNMDFAISSTDDDLFYVPNGDNTSAWFSSARDSKPGFVNVYRVFIQRFPSTIAYMNVDFESQAFPNNHRATIKLIRVSNKKEIGTYHSDDKGNFSIPIYYPGEYTYLLDIYGIQKEFTLNFTLPKVTDKTEYHQRIVHKQVDLSDYVELMFLQENTIANDDPRLLDAIRQKSNLEVNSDMETPNQSQLENSRSKLADSLALGKKALNDKLDLEAKINQKIFDNLNQILGLQQDVKTTVAHHQDLMATDPKIIEETHNKVTTINRLKAQNNTLIHLSDSMAQVNQKTLPQLENITEAEGEISTSNIKSEEDLKNYRTKNKQLIADVQNIIAESNKKDVFSKYDILKKNISQYNSDKAEKERQLDVQNTELATLKEQAEILKEGSKKRIAIEQQIETKTQQIQQSKDDIAYLEKKIASTNEEIKPLQEQKDILLDINQTNVISTISNEQINKQIATSNEQNLKYSPINKLIEKTYNSQNKQNELSYSDLTQDNTKTAWDNYTKVTRDKTASNLAVGKASKELLNNLQAEKDSLLKITNPQPKDKLLISKIENKISDLQLNISPTDTTTLAGNNDSIVNPVINSSGSQFINERFPILKRQLENSISQNDSSQIKTIFNDALSEINKQIDAQKTLVINNPKNKDFVLTQTQLENLKKSLIETESKWELQKMQQTATISQQPKTVDAWTEELSPTYNQKVQSINNNASDDLKQAIDLKNEEEDLLAKVNEKRKNISSQALDSLKNELEVSIKRYNDRIDYIGERNNNEVAQTNDAIQKAIEQLKLDSDENLFDSQIDDIKQSLDKQFEKLNHTKDELIKEGRPTDFIQSNLDKLAQTAEILDAKVNEYQQIETAESTLTDSTNILAENHPAENKAQNANPTENNNSNLAENHPAENKAKNANPTENNNSNLAENHPVENKAQNTNPTENNNSNLTENHSVENKAQNANPTENNNSNLTENHPVENKAQNVNPTENNNSNLTENHSVENKAQNANPTENNNSNLTENHSVENKAQNTNPTENNNSNLTENHPVENKAQNANPTENNNSNLTENHSVENKAQDANPKENNNSNLTENHSVENKAKNENPTENNNSNLTENHSVENKAQNTNPTENNNSNLTENHSVENKTQNTNPTDSTNILAENHSVENKAQNANPTENNNSNLTENHSVENKAKNANPTENNNSNLTENHSVENKAQNANPTENNNSNLTENHSVENKAQNANPTENNNSNLTENHSSKDNLAIIQSIQNKNVVDNINKDQVLTDSIENLKIPSSEITTQKNTTKIEIGDLENYLNTVVTNDSPQKENLSKSINDAKILSKSEDKQLQKIGRNQGEFIQNEISNLELENNLQKIDKDEKMPDSLNQSRLVSLKSELQNTQNVLQQAININEKQNKKDKENQSMVIQTLNKKVKYIQTEISRTNENTAERNKELSDIEKSYQQFIHLDSIVINSRNANPEKVALHKVLIKEYEQLKDLDTKEQIVKTQIAIDSKADNKVIAQLKEIQQLKSELKALIASNLEQFKNEIEQPTSQLVAEKSHEEIHQEVAEATFQIHPQHVVSADELKTILNSNSYPKGLFYRIQVGAFFKPINENVYRDFSPITMENLNKGLIKYMAGYFTDEASAITARQQIRQLGFNDAFIVAYCDGHRISVFEARQRLADKTCLPVTDKELMFHVDSSKAKQMTELVNVNTENPNIIPTENKTDENKEIQEVTQIKDLYLTVQIGVFNRYVDKEYTKGMTPINTDAIAPNTIRYSVGRFNNLDSAKAQRLIAIQKGFTDAFIVAYFEGKRITVNQALQLVAENKAKFIDIAINKDSINPKNNLVPVKNYFDEYQKEVLTPNTKGAITASTATVTKIQEPTLILTSEVPTIKVSLYWWLISNFNNFEFERTPNGLFIYCYGNDAARQELKKEFVRLYFKNVSLQK